MLDVVFDYYFLLLDSIYVTVHDPGYECALPLL